MLKFPYGLECQNNTTDAERSFMAEQPLIAAAFGFYLSLYLAGKLRVFTNGTTLGRVLICFIPSYYSVVMAFEVIAENRNHAPDTFYALGLGAACATFSYVLTFESLFSNPGLVGLPLNRVSPPPSKNENNRSSTRVRGEYEMIEEPPRS
eukprot:TRINITY_DN1566_c0_g1_i1.p2 TRINITY_DN1566_c0_g1~~TRINITY_DN1566_c0_g1_i1.p2  ORF type:complete len:150 (-),score=24.77 TRINITY_DN1566_c0_g1_i1:540-989(-)